jgi:hypothetical protein
VVDKNLKKIKKFLEKMLKNENRTAGQPSIQ